MHREAFKQVMGSSRLSINYYHVSVENASRRLREVLSGMLDVKGSCILRFGFEEGLCSGLGYRCFS